MARRPQLSRVPAQAALWDHEGRLLGVMRHGAFVPAEEFIVCYSRQPEVPPLVLHRPQIEVSHDAHTAIVRGSGRDGESVRPIWSDDGELLGVMDRGHFIARDSIYIAV
jgi:hypothetical protein